MSKARRAVPDLHFNGKDVNTSLADYLESFSYDDVASGASDTIALTVYNENMKWMKAWLPKKGDRITAKIKFTDWNQEGDNRNLDCGDFLLDSMKMSGGPLTADLEGISLPTDSSIKTTNRTKTWKNTTIKQIGAEIAKKYGLKYTYDGPNHAIESLEQTDRSDSDFLYELAKKYGLGMKIYKTKIILYGKNEYEAKSSVLTLHRSDFIGDDWEWTDTLEHTYTGGRCSYKSNNSKKKSSTDKEISIYVGSGENAAGARTLKVSEQAANESDAIAIIQAAVNNANEKACTLTGTVWANPKLVAGIVITLEGFGKADTKYFVDEVKTKVDPRSGTTQSITLHKIQKKCKAPAPKPAAAAPAKKKDYKVGDIVNFHGGKHYVSSYASARGYNARAGKARITLGPNCRGNGHAHPWHLIHVDGSSNVYGWVDEGTFD